MFQQGPITTLLNIREVNFKVIFAVTSIEMSLFQSFGNWEFKFGKPGKGIWVRKGQNMGVLYSGMFQPPHKLT